MTRVIGVFLVPMLAFVAYFVTQKTKADASVASDVKRIADVMEKGCR